MNILIGTKNKAKLEEIKNALKDIIDKGVKLITLEQMQIPDAPETGKTFEENAVLKAKFYYEKTSIPTLSDDGGIVIPYLNGEPGVLSRKWLGYDASDEELIEYTLMRMKNATGDDRYAYLQTVVAFYDGKNVFIEEQKIDGYIATTQHKKIIKGYPFRSLFVIKNLNKYYCELDELEHNEVNHRIKAVKKLAKKILEHYLKPESI
ncbi:MAG: hypothetical protein NZ870_00740 [bacterium]|nr:hypothetical protein [bacterium]